MGTVVRYAAPPVGRPRERRERSATILIFPGVRIERLETPATPSPAPASPRRRGRAKKAT